MSIFLNSRNYDKATKNHIKYYINKAIERKKWAMSLDLDYVQKNSCELTNDMVNDYLNKSIHILARQALDYARLRAFLGLSGGKTYPWDKPAYNLWNDLKKGIIEA